MRGEARQESSPLAVRSLRTAKERSAVSAKQKHALIRTALAIERTLGRICGAEVSNQLSEDAFDPSAPLTSSQPDLELLDIIDSQPIIRSSSYSTPKKVPSASHPSNKDAKEAEFMHSRFVPLLSMKFSSSSNALLSTSPSPVLRFLTVGATGRYDSMVEEVSTMVSGAFLTGAVDAVADACSDSTVATSLPFLLFFFFLLAVASGAGAAAGAAAATGATFDFLEAKMSSISDAAARFLGAGVGTALEVLAWGAGGALAMVDVERR